MGASSSSSASSSMPGAGAGVAAQIIREACDLKSGEELCGVIRNGRTVSKGGVESHESFLGIKAGKRDSRIKYIADATLQKMAKGKGKGKAADEQYSKACGTILTSINQAIQVINGKKGRGAGDPVLVKRIVSAANKRIDAGGYERTQRLIKDQVTNQLRNYANEIASAFQDRELIRSGVMSPDALKDTHLLKSEVVEHVQNMYKAKQAAPGRLSPDIDRYSLQGRFTFFDPDNSLIDLGEPYEADTSFGEYFTDTILNTLMQQTGMTTEDGDALNAEGLEVRELALDSLDSDKSAEGLQEELNEFISTLAKHESPNRRMLAFLLTAMSQDGIVQIGHRIGFLGREAAKDRELMGSAVEVDNNTVQFQINPSEGVVKVSGVFKNNDWRTEGIRHLTTATTTLHFVPGDDPEKDQVKVDFSIALQGNKRKGSSFADEETSLYAGNLKAAGFEPVISERPPLGVYPEFINTFCDQVINSEAIAATDGILRISPTHDEMIQLYENAKSGKEIDFTTLSPHLVVGVVKLHLREMSSRVLDGVDLDLLQEPLDSAKKREAVRQHLHANMNAEKRDLLSKLFDLTGAILAQADTNRMTLNNIAIVLAPNVAPNIETEDPMAEIAAAETRKQAFMTLFENRDLLNPPPIPDFPT